MATKKQQLEQSQQAIGDFIKLSDFLFGENAPTDVNEIPEEHPFYKDFKAISDEMELDWKNMEHADSNRVMLNVLAEYYYRIQPDEKYQPVVTISFTPRK